ncbi:hypothetical protein [Actinocrispum sp. NPDC049592]|uniref:hypothetical protein n=1 Tax=Actinocrispum sp. NPDC049592 TaxID=3154835 RepID=UPI003421DAC8
MVRLGDETSAVGADVRAALASWGRGEQVAGGIALLGCTPPDCPEAVDAILVLPRGLVVIVGVDLPDPAMRMDAPVGGQWKIDGWPLVREDGAVNPATEALAAAGAVARLLQAKRVEPMPIGTVIAVGPYVARVSQPSNDLARGIRILHPEPSTLLTATRELAVYERRCPANRANDVLAALAPDLPPLRVEELLAEGFDAVSTTGLAAASTMLIPRVPAAREPSAAPRTTPKKYGWLPIGAAALVGALLLTGIVAAVLASGGSSSSAPSGAPVPVVQQSSAAVDGIQYMSKGSAKDTECAQRTVGDMQAWLQAHKCVQLVRTRYETTAAKAPVAVLVADLTFPDAVTAGQFRKLADTTGVGSVNDLSADGTPWPDGRKPIFDSAAYKTSQADLRVRIVQAVWMDKPSAAQDPLLVTSADRALKLPAS